MNVLIGHTGTVGSNLKDQLKYDAFFNLSNINDIKDLECHTVCCAGIPSNKWWSNKNPKEDLHNINNLIENLSHVRCDKFIHISTIDVYANIIGQNEDSPKCDTSHHAYGFNRYHAEIELKKIFEDKLTIVRLPAVFGKHLKKNVLYDLIHKQYFSKINLENTYQWYYLNNIAEDIQYCIDSNIKEVNLFTQPIKLKNVVETFFVVDNEFMYSDTNGAVLYDLKTKHKNGGYWNDKHKVVENLKEWLEHV